MARGSRWRLLDRGRDPARGRPCRRRRFRRRDLRRCGGGALAGVRAAPRHSAFEDGVMLMRAGLLAAVGVAAIASSGAASAQARTQTQTQTQRRRGDACHGRGAGAGGPGRAAADAARRAGQHLQHQSDNHGGAAVAARDSTRASISPAPPAGRRSRRRPGSTRISSLTMSARPRTAAISAPASTSAMPLYSGGTGPQRRPRRQYPRRGRPRRSARDRGRYLHRGGLRLHGRDPRPLDRPAQPESGSRPRNQFAGDARPLRGRRSHPHRRRPVRRAARARPLRASPPRRGGCAAARRITAA